MVNELSFESVRKLSSNGKKPFPAKIGEVTVRVGARREARLARIDFDLYLGCMQVKEGSLERLRAEYQDYLRTASPRKGRISDFNSHFSRRTIWFEVRQADAGGWFNRIKCVLSDPEQVVVDPEIVDFVDACQVFEDLLPIAVRKRVHAEAAT